jgi:hypothetical protein
VIDERHDAGLEFHLTLNGGRVGGPDALCSGIGVGTRLFERHAGLALGK